MSAPSVRYALIGSGMMGVEHVRNLALLRRRRPEEGITLSAICDSHEGSVARALEVFAEWFGVFVAPPACFRGLDEMLDAKAADLDAIIIATPNFHHEEAVSVVLRRAPHVAILVEKPLCTTTAAALRVLQQVRERDATVVGSSPAPAAPVAPPPVWVAMEYRYMPPIARLLEHVRDGFVGDRVHMSTIVEHRFPFLPKVRSWNRWRELTGDTLVEKSCHFFDLQRLLHRPARPVTVAALGGRSVNFQEERYGPRGDRPDILDSATVLIEFSDGSRACHELCMFAEGSRNQESVHAIGAEGKVEVGVPEGILYAGKREAGREGVRATVVESDAEALEAGCHGGSTFVEHLLFLDAIRGRGPVHVTVEDGVWAVAMGEAAQRSVRERRFVDLDEVLGPDGLAALRVTPLLAADGADSTVDEPSEAPSAVAMIVRGEEPELAAPLDVMSARSIALYSKP